LLRIAFVVHKLPPDSLGGVETYSWSLARALAASGHEVYVFYPVPGAPPGGARREEGGVHLWQVTLPRSRAGEGPATQYWHTFRDSAIEAAFEEFLREAQPEVVHFQHVQGVSARLISLAKGRPRLLTLQDYWFFCFNSQLLRPDQQMCGGPQFGWNCVDCATVRPDLRKFRPLRPLIALPLAYRNRYLRKVCGEIDLFLAPSEFLRQQYTRQGFPARRIATVEYGLDRTRLADVPGLALPPPAARPHFGFIGSIASHKGVHVLVEAFNRMPPDVALTLYGSEAGFPEYAARIRAMVRHPHVRFAGPIDHHHVGGALRQIDCLVMSSIWYENSPLVIREAFAAGVPVVASRLGALPEKVEEGVTGRLFTAGDADDLARVLLDLIVQPQQLALLAKNIRPGPDIYAHSELLVNIYRSLVRGVPAHAIVEEIREGSGVEAGDRSAGPLAGRT
jgi:glycosyltransferase involved in cell wall biosynthesis